MGLKLDDFLEMDRDEFEAACESFADHEERQERDRWERTRLLGLMAVQPWCKKRMTAEQLLPLPWDRREEAREPEHVRLSHAERLRRMEEARKRMGERY